MAFPTLDQWLAVALLGLAVWLIIPREPELIMPEPRQSLLRRVLELRTRWRGNAVWGTDNSDPDGDGFVRSITQDFPQLPQRHAPGRHRPLANLVVTLPSFQSAPRTDLVTDQQPPWDAPEPRHQPPPPTGPHAWYPGSHRDPPTLVNNMRVLMEDDPDGVQHYVDGLPRYES